MKVLHLNSSDSSGGAAKAALRLHRALRKSGVDSRILVQERLIDDPFIYGPDTDFKKVLSVFRPYLDRLPLLLSGKGLKTLFHPQWLPNRLERKILHINPDIIHLHWICGGFVNISMLKKINKPIVWTLHDMWPFTGGCHYSGDCVSYKNKCGNCPLLGSRSELDLSRITWKRKKKEWDGLDILLVAPSRWAEVCASQSSLFENKRITRLANGVDLTIYKTLQKSAARKILNLPIDKRIILFGSIKATKDNRKGFQYLKSAIGELEKRTEIDNLMLIVFGGSDFRNIWHDKIPVVFYGIFHDDISLSILYSAVDVFVLPSIEDNLPNTIIESLSCGTPCVAFNTGGLPDMIQHKKNGYLAEYLNTKDLSSGIKWVLEDGERYKKLAQYSRRTAEEKYDIEKVAQRYCGLYKAQI